MSKPKFELKVKNKCIPLEDIIVGKRYVFTINPCDKYQHFRSMNRMGNCLADLEKEIFCVQSKTYQTDIWPELSPRGRFHLHGYIRIYKPIEFMLYVIPSWCTKASFTIEQEKECDSEKWDDWHDYCNKQECFHIFLQTNHFITIPMSFGVSEKELIEMEEELES